MDRWTQQGEERVEQLETVMLKYVYHHVWNRWKLRITQELSLLLCDNSEGWGRLRREGIYVHLWLIHVVGQQTPTRDCKAIIFQLNTFFKKSQQITSIDEDVEKGGLLCTVGGNVSWGSRCGKQNGGSSTNRTTVRSSSAGPGYLSRESENTN